MSASKFPPSKEWFHGSKQPLEGSLKAIYLTPSLSLAKMHGGSVSTFQIDPGANWTDIQELFLPYSMDSIGYVAGMGEKLKARGIDVLWDQEDYQNGHAQIWVLNPEVLKRKNVEMKENYSIDEFHQMVREMIQEAVRDHMLNELERLNLKELGGVEGSSSSGTSSSSTETSGTADTLGTLSTKATNSGNDDPANNVLVPGTNLPLNAGLQAASKEKNFKKKADLINKISAQLAAMKGVVVKEDSSS